MTLDQLQAKLDRVHRSFTIWFNGLMAAAVPALIFAQDQLPLLKEYLPTDFYGMAFIAVIVGNIVLRFHTSLPLEQK